MAKLSKWSAVPALALLLAASRGAHSVATPQAPDKSLPGAPTRTAVLAESSVRSYTPDKRFVITLDLGTTAVSTKKDDYACALTYLGDDGSADGKPTTDPWTCISAHAHPKLKGNIVTLKFLAKRSLPVKVKHKFDGTTGTGTIVISMPNISSPPATPQIPVDDAGLDPCDDN